MTQQHNGRWRNNNNNNHQSGTGAPQRLEVLSADMTRLFTAPMTAISHLPRGYERLPRLTACREHGPTAASARGSQGQCPLGSRCRFVHVDVAPACLPGHAVHTHFVYRDVGLVPHERLSTAGERALQLPAGALDEVTVSVLGPNKVGATETVPARLLLHTRGALATLLHAATTTHRQCANHKKSAAAASAATAPSRTSHCAHYYFRGLCERGADCAFAHIVSIDASITANAIRGPPPVIAARSSEETQQQPQQHAQDTPPYLVNASGATTQQHSYASAGTADCSDHDDGRERSASGSYSVSSSGSHTQARHATFLPLSSDCGTAAHHHQPLSADDSSLSPKVALRYSHDPYSTDAARTRIKHF